MECKSELLEILKLNEVIYVFCNLFCFKVLAFLTPKYSLHYNIFRDPPTTKLEISPHLELVLLYQFQFLVMIPGIIINITGPKRHVVFLLMNGKFLCQNTHASTI